MEFSEGDSVLLNLHSLSLLRSEKGRGKKLLMKYDRPFEVIQKLSPVSYQLWMPAYGIHPIINIVHLEKYQPLFTMPVQSCLTLPANSKSNDLAIYCIPQFNPSIITTVLET